MIDYTYFWDHYMDFFDDLPKEWKMVIFCCKIVECCFNYFDIKQEIHERGRKPFELLKMLKLITFASLNGITSSIIISNYSKYHELYECVSDYLMPSDRTIRKYKREYGDVFRKITSFTLIVAHTIKLTDFKHIAIDGTIQKAFNSPFYVLKMKQIEILLNHFCKEELTEDEIKKLPRSVKKFLKNKKFNEIEKIEILLTLRDILEESGQSSIAINDWTARWMYNKQGKAQLSFNIQSAVDSSTKLICGANVSQNPTDHYEIPEIMEIVIENLEGHKPIKISADTIYRTIPNLTYLTENGIGFLIPTRKQGKSQINNLSDNSFSIDYFAFDHEKRIVICPMKNELKEYGPYECEPDKFGYQRKQYAYSNSKACQKCKHKKECCKDTHHRTITRYGHELLDEAEKVMEIEENQKEYKKRSSTVEAPNGSYKIYYHINEMPIVGIDNVQSIYNIITSGYNIKRLFNIFEENDVDLKEVIKFIEELSNKNEDKLPQINLEKYYENQNEKCSAC